MQNAIVLLACVCGAVVCSYKAVVAENNDGGYWLLSIAAIVYFYHSVQ
jgi:glycosyltransferase A (GT-A) superfamily protein (DUF2064 family)